MTRALALLVAGGVWAPLLGAQTPTEFVIQRQGQRTTETALL